VTPKLARVLAHIAGPSGAGKTTLLKELASQYPDLHTKDLDVFDWAASAELYPDVRKAQYTDEMLEAVNTRRQEMLDAYLAELAGEDVVLGGYHTEGPKVQDVYTDNKYMLNTGPALSAWRKYLRNWNHPRRSHSFTELPTLYRQNSQDTEEILSMGYEPKNKQEILQLIEEMLMSKTGQSLQPSIPLQKRLRNKLASRGLRPGAFTKHSNAKALLAILGGAPILGAMSGLHASGGSNPLEAGLGGAAGGVTGGLAGAGAGAALMAAIQLFGKGGVDPKVMTQAATLAGLLGALKGGQLGSGSAMTASGLTQEALLAGILGELQSQNQYCDDRPGDHSLPRGADQGVSSVASWAVRGA
jgi:hypothetical protein